MTCILFGPLLLLGFVLSAAALSPSRPASRNTLNLPGTPYRYANVELPAHFTQPGRNDDNTPPDNPLTDAGATLGRVLFYDTRLSANNTTSCASCHVQTHAFADPKPFSKGFHGALTDCRAMPLVNLRYYQRARFFWDERAGNLEEMVLAPYPKPDRDGTGPEAGRGHSCRAMRRIPCSSGAHLAIGRLPISESGRRSHSSSDPIVSYQSRYDEGRARARSAPDDFDNFTLQENRGKALFMRNCSTCHMKDGNEHFFVPTPANTGLRGDRSDCRRWRWRRDAPSRGPRLVQVPLAPQRRGHGPVWSRRTLRDAGRADRSLQRQSDLDPNLGYVIPVGPLKFTASEKAALIAFLRTLTDAEMPDRSQILESVCE